jgi:hypothetical protein
VIGSQPFPAQDQSGWCASYDHNAATQAPASDAVGAEIRSVDGTVTREIDVAITASIWVREVVKLGQHDGDARGRTMLRYFKNLPYA